MQPEKHLIAGVGLVMAFCPFTRTGGGRFVFQTAGETRFVVNCRLPVILVGHVKTALGPEKTMASAGRGWKARSLPPDNPEAKVLCVPSGVNS